MDFISDGSEVWWDIRPSHKYPTVEPRICDVCPRIEDALCIAAIYASLIRMLLRQHRRAPCPRNLRQRSSREQVARAALRHAGLPGGHPPRRPHRHRRAFLGDTRRGGRIDIAEEVEALVAELPTTHERWVARPSCAAVSTSCAKARAPTSRSTCTALRRLEGASEQEALRAVVDLVVAQTGANLDD